ncbi:hypothetical protein FIM67_02110 [Helicobacter pylori]|nr:hypothetical protein FIM67_02110 [Helicobacter pylori]
MEKFCHFFDFGVFGLVLAHKKGVTINKKLDFAITSLKSTLLGRSPLVRKFISCGRNCAGCLYPQHKRLYRLKCHKLDQSLSQNALL